MSYQLGSNARIAQRDRTVKSVTCAIFLLLAFGMVAHAEVYKWVDADGNVHFSDTPPPNQDTEEVKIQGSSSSSLSSRSRTSTGGDGGNVSADDRKLCSKAVSNLSRFSAVWERKIRAKMPDMGAAEKAKAEQAIKELRANIKEAKSDMSQCTNDLDDPKNRSAAECIANAPNADAAMFCVL
jgi:hypothetical protein